MQPWVSLLSRCPASVRTYTSKTWLPMETLRSYLESSERDTKLCNYHLIAVASISILTKSHGRKVVIMFFQGFILNSTDGKTSMRLVWLLSYHFLCTWALLSTPTPRVTKYTYPSIFELPTYEYYFRYNEEPTFVRGPSIRFVTNAEEYISTQQNLHFNVNYFKKLY
jgi:hypothetical protein